MKEAMISSNIIPKAAKNLCFLHISSTFFIGNGLKISKNLKSKKLHNKATTERLPKEYKIYAPKKIPQASSITIYPGSRFESPSYLKRKRSIHIIPNMKQLRLIQPSILGALNNSESTQRRVANNEPIVPGHLVGISPDLKNETINKVI